MSLPLSTGKRNMLKASKSIERKGFAASKQGGRAQSVVCVKSEVMRLWGFRSTRVHGLLALPRYIWAQQFGETELFSAPKLTDFYPQKQGCQLENSWPTRVRQSYDFENMMGRDEKTTAGRSFSLR